jgi:hypothetical protein
LRVVTENRARFVSIEMSLVATHLSEHRGRSILRRAIAGLFLLAALLAVASTVTRNRRHYDVAPGDAATTLRQISAISGREILFAADVVRGVRTNAVRGDLTPLEAVTQLLAGTTLVVVEDAKTGGLAVRERPPQPRPPPPPRAP